MKNTTLTVTFNTEKLDALTFHMEKREADLQTELNDTVQRLYEKYVPQATREYIDDKVSRDAAGKDRRRRAQRKPWREATPNRFRPCKPLWAAVSAFWERSGTCIP